MLPQGFSFHLMPEAPSQSCWQRVSCGGDESIHFPASQAKLCLQPPDGCISRSCQLLLTAMSTTSCDYTLRHLSYFIQLVLHILHFPALPNSTAEVTLTDYTGDSSSASTEITTHNSTVLDLNKEQHTSQDHSLTHVFCVINRPDTRLVASSS